MIIILLIIHTYLDSTKLCGMRVELLFLYCILFSKKAKFFFRLWPGRMGSDASSVDMVAYQSDGEEVDIAKIIHPGYRFCPTDDVLVGFYLKSKISNQRLPKDRVFDVKLYQFNPDELSGLFLFFCFF